MQAVNFDAVLDQIVAKDPRYYRDAYLFIREALDFTQKMIGRPKKHEIRHVTGKELLEGIREFGLQQFGPMATMVFKEWGIQSTEDFGEIVFNMVEWNVLAKTDHDSREDFKDGYNFFETFRAPCLPTKSPSRCLPESTSAEV
jgi:uncharacterized repeat protein (TIGR04138 family)